MHLGIDFGENPCSTCGKLLPTGLGATTARAEDSKTEAALAGI